MKDKKCKGINKAHGYDGCGEMVLAVTRRYGLCPKCFFNWMQETAQGKLHYEKQFIQKVKKNLSKEEKKREAEQKDKYTDWAKKLVVKCQEIARLIDVGQPCLAKGNHASQMHGGHVFSRGSNPSMKFNLHNIHRQGAQSNHFQNDDGLLREGLIREYGQGYFNFISSMRRIPALKLSNLEYKEKYRIACKLANKYRKEGKTFTKDQRIWERHQVNAALGIYPPEYC